MFYGSSCMVRCQKGVQALGGQFENEFGSTILPTLAGQVLEHVDILKNRSVAFV